MGPTQPYLHGRDCRKTDSNYSLSGSIQAGLMAQRDRLRSILETRGIGLHWKLLEIPTSQEQRFTILIPIW